MHCTWDYTLSINLYKDCKLLRQDQSALMSSSDVLHILSAFLQWIRKTTAQMHFLILFPLCFFFCHIFTSASLCESPNSLGMKVKLSFHLQGMWQDTLLGRHISVCLCSSPSSQLKCNPLKSKCCTAPWVYPCMWLFQGDFWDTCREISLCSIVCILVHCWGKEENGGCGSPCLY